MINLTAARLIWLLYTSDWVEEGAGSGLDLVWWMSSSRAPLGQQLHLLRPCRLPSPGCSLVVLCPPLVTASCSLTFPLPMLAAVNLFALTL